MAEYGRTESIWITAAVEAAFQELVRQCPTTDDLSPNQDRSMVLPYDGFDLKKLIETAYDALP